MPTKSDGLDPRTARILGRVRAIPAGFVRTYGDIDPKAPRLVGRILATTTERLPWHRVVRADGRVAKGKRQRHLGEARLRGARRADQLPRRNPRRVRAARSRGTLGPAVEHDVVPRARFGA